MLSKISFYFFSKLVRVIWEVFLSLFPIHLGLLHLSFRLFPEVPQTFLQDDGESIWHSLLRKAFNFLLGSGLKKPICSHM